MKTWTMRSIWFTRARFAAASLVIAAFGWIISYRPAAAQTAPTPKKSVETYYFMVFSNPVPGTEDEYNKWYTNLHQLDVVSIPGFMTAQRYVVSENQLRMSKPLPKYLVSYKIVTDDLPSVFQEVHRRLQTGETKMSPTFDGKTSVSFTYKAIQPVIYHKGDQPKPVGGETHTYAQIVFSNPTTPGQEDEYNRWYRDQHLPDVVSAPGWVHAQRFVLSDVQSTSKMQWPYKYLAMFEIVSDDWPARILDFKRIGPTQSKSDAMGPSLGYTYTVLGPMIDGDKVRADRAARKLSSQK
jgi:hypothetical protein